MYTVASTKCFLVGGSDKVGVIVLSTCDLFNIHDVHTNSVSPLPHYSVLLSNANLTLARGRRYGLVGRNGEGLSPW